MHFEESGTSFMRLLLGFELVVRRKYSNENYREKLHTKLVSGKNNKHILERSLSKRFLELKKTKYKMLSWLFLIT